VSRTRLRIPRWIAAPLALILAVTGLVLTAPAQARAAADDQQVTEASFIWGLSGYAQKGIFGPWNFKDLTGNATLLTGSVSGGDQTEYTPGGYPATSMEATSPQKTPNAVKFTSGEGFVNTRTGEAELSWSGSYTVNAYPAMFNAPNEIYHDPMLTVDAEGNGELSMHFVLGAGTDMSGNPTPETDLGRVTLVTLSNVVVTPTGFTVIPDYQGVTLDASRMSDTSAQVTNCTAPNGWGSWSPEFVYAMPAFVRPHFYSTSCGGMQERKPALPIQVAYTVEALVPTVTVSKTIGLDGDGETITVSGSGFVPSAPATDGTRPPLAGSFGGVYVAFGRFADDWQPSSGAPSSSRRTSDVFWAVPAASMAAVGGPERGAIELAPDGTFSVTFEVAKDLADVAGEYGVYTYPGGGAVYAPFETATPIAFAPEPTALTFTTSPAAQVTEGGLVTLAAQLESPLSGAVAFANGGTALGAVRATDAGTASLVIPSPPVGTHTLTATFTPDDVEEFATSSASLTFTVTPRVVAAGSLTWGFKQSFRDYVVSTIAHGSITTSDVGTSGGAFVFGQQPGGTFDGTSGTSRYSGSVRFVGHGGVLDLTIANPVVEIVSSTRGTLYVTVNGSQVAFASLDLASGIRSTPGNTVSYAGVPASLTSQGAAYFSYNGSSFYAPGTQLDAVSFVIGSPSSGGSGTTTISAYAENVPAIAPATEGLELIGDQKVVEGGTVTVRGEGFESNEEGIMAVIYSEPVVLARDVAADAEGVAQWSGRLPSGLTGEHTLTLQGSVDRGIVLDIAPKTATVEGCTVEASQLDWGVKESFRSYISGSIANGEWTVADGATYETPLFGWSDGEGAYDIDAHEGLVAFDGTVTFTGHGGILNTTLANPQIEFVNADSAILLLDVRGTTQEGAVIDQSTVEFAEIDLGGGEVALDDGTFTVVDAPATLAAAGAEAFGTYEVGTELDPISVTLELDARCATEASVPVATPDPEVTSSTGPDLGWLAWLIVGIVVIGAAAGVVIWRMRARKA
jgi:hypothetical protein